jgi:hypothetical protein
MINFITTISKLTIISFKESLFLGSYNPLTFSKIKALGLAFFTTLIVSFQSFPLGSSKPFFFPATDQAWQGTPPTIKSDLGELFLLK